ncbi:MAG TPA: hypothetical protein VGN97_13375 [Mesorhizobium sp.]|jgi:hypothetical protein|nr:hypothetical protein [Mesorhizobium sp.]
MPLALNLPSYVVDALQKFATEEGVGLENAAGIAVIEWLIAQGYLADDELSEDTPTEGNA